MAYQNTNDGCTPSFSSAELERFSFVEMCELLPADVHWGDMLTPDILREVVMAVESRERAACCKAIDEIDDGEAPEYRACQEAILKRSNE